MTRIKFLPVLAAMLMVSAPAFAAEKPAPVPPIGKFMQDSSECKEIAVRPNSKGEAPSTYDLTNTYLNCMTLRNYTEEDVKNRTRDNMIDFSVKPPGANNNSMMPSAIPPAKK